MKIPVNFRKIAKSQEGDWYRLTDILDELSITKTNVTFWANDIRRHLHGHICSLTFDTGKAELTCLYTTLEGLIYLALRVDSRMRQEVIEATMAGKLPFPVKELGMAVSHDGRQWYSFTKVVNCVVHDGNPPNQTVTTTINVVPRSEIAQISQRIGDTERFGSRSWHITPLGIMHYLMNSKTSYSCKYKAEVAKKVAAILKDNAMKRA